MLAVHNDGTQYSVLLAHSVSYVLVKVTSPGNYQLKEVAVTGEHVDLFCSHVDVVKAGKVLQLQCYYVENDEADPTVQHVALFLKRGEDNIGNMYERPRFAELDDKLQQAFTWFVVARGIDANVGQHV